MDFKWLFGLLSSRNFATMATWRNNFSFLLPTTTGEARLPYSQVTVRSNVGFQLSFSFFPSLSFTEVTFSSSELFFWQELCSIWQELGGVSAGNSVIIKKISSLWQSLQTRNIKMEKKTNWFKPQINPPKKRTIWFYFPPPSFPCGESDTTLLDSSYTGHPGILRINPHYWKGVHS